MKSTLISLVVLLACGVARLEAGDTITTLDNVSIFGRVVEMNKDTVRLVARFPSNGPGSPVTEETLTLKRAHLRRIEFNQTTFNPGGPPSTGLKPSGGRAAQPPAAQPPADVVILNGGEHRECELASINGDEVTCGAVLDRRKVIRILLGSR
jgi:hypothetical protein